MVEVAGFEVDIPREFLDGIFSLRLPSPNPRRSCCCEDVVSCSNLGVSDCGFHVGVDVPGSNLYFLMLRIPVPYLGSLVVLLCLARLVF